jgi:hypothetical protein
LEQQPPASADATTVHLVKVHWSLDGAPVQVAHKPGEFEQLVGGI